jgi:hypothetical protein
MTLQGFVSVVSSVIPSAEPGTGIVSLRNLFLEGSELWVKFLTKNEEYLKPQSNLPTEKLLGK